MQQSVFNIVVQFLIRYKYFQFYRFLYWCNMWIGLILKHYIKF